jgi:glycosyltransferase involved in cell wall biosynthesis
MNILLVCDYYQPLGGTEQYVQSISEALEEIGHRVVVLYGIKTEATLNVPHRSEYHIPEIIRADTEIDKSTWRRLSEIIDATHPDVAYFQNVPNAGLIRAVSKVLPAIRHIHDHRFFCPKGDKLFLISGKTCNRPFGIGCYLNTLWRGCLHPLPNISLPLIYSRKKAFHLHENVRIVVASEYMKKCLSYNGFRLSSIEMIPYFSNFSSTGKCEFNNFVFFAGRIIRQKGLLYLLRSMKSWPQNLQLVVAGDGPEKYRMMKYANALGVNQKVTFLGNLSNLETRSYYEKCLCVAVPSIWDEPFGIVGIEAMSCGKPVVAFGVGGVPDWLTHERNGFVLPRKNSAAMGLAIRQLFNRREIAKQMGEEGRKIYVDGFSRQKHLEKLICLFRSVSTPAA